MRKKTSVEELKDNSDKSDRALSENTNSNKRHNADDKFRIMIGSPKKGDPNEIKNKNFNEKSDHLKNIENSEQTHIESPIIKVTTGNPSIQDNEGPSKSNMNSDINSPTSKTNPVIKIKKPKQNNLNLIDSDASHGIDEDLGFSESHSPPQKSGIYEVGAVENPEQDRNLQSAHSFSGSVANDYSSIPSSFSDEISENAENLLLFKNRAEQTVEKNSQFTSSEKMADNEVQRNFKISHLDQKPIGDANMSMETSETHENYPNIFDIQPISSYTTTHQSFRRINDYPEEMTISRYDPLVELRNIAKLEANNFKDSLEETYFSPPVSPSKHHPLHYLKTAVYNEENYQRPEPKPKTKKVAREISLDNESELVEMEKDILNEFDESIFHYNSETKMYACPWEGCGKAFPSLSRIKRHYIIHTKLKPFKCLNKGCNRRFSRKDNMLQHYRVHCPFAHKKNS